MIKGPVSARDGLHWPEDLVAFYSAEYLGLVRAAFLICGSVASAEDAVHDAVTRVAPRWDGALSRLPVNHRAAIVLRYFLDWDVDEIARHFAVRPTTVRSWVHRGIGRLRKDWDR